MSITLDEFKSKYNPDIGEIQFLLSGSLVNAMIVSIQDCQSENVERTLRTMTNTIVIIDGQNYTTSVKEIVNKGSHYYFELDPFTVDSTGSISNCAVSIYAYDENSTTFTNGEYNPLINNASDPGSINYIYDVDRKSSQISPANLQGILSGSSQPALIQLSNYSITGLINSKYNGAKTNVNDYGTVPLISGRIFQGANYPLGTETTLICSLLYNSTFEEGETDSDFYIQRTVDQNTVEEFLFAPNPSLENPPSNTIPEIRSQTVDMNFGSINDNDTELSFTTVTGTGLPVPGDVLKLTATSGLIIFEYVKVTKIEGSTITCIRGYKSEITGGETSKNFSSAPLVTKIQGDIVYKLENNSFYKLSESLIAVAESEKVYYVDDNGGLLFLVRNCTPDI